MPAKITQKTIEAAFRRRDAALDRGETSYRERIRDIEPGLVLEIGARGASWRREYRPRGTTPDGRRVPGRTIVLGDLHLTPDAARKAAAEIGRQVAEGRDPADERRIEVARRTAERLAGRTCSELLPEFEADLRSRQNAARGRAVTPQHVSHQIGMVRRALDDLGAGDLRPADLDPTRLRARYRGAAGATPRHEHGALARFFAFALAAGHLQDNPLASVPAPKPGRARERALSGEELRAAWDGAEALHPSCRDLVRLLIALPARRGEVAAMRWGDLEATHWRQGETKNGREHRLLLTDRVRGILDARRAAVGREPRPTDLVFPAPQGRGLITGWSKLLAGLHRASGTSGWALHDLRRTSVSMLAEADLGLAESDIDLVLNHAASASRGGVLGIYQRASRQRQQDRVVEAWTLLLDGILESRQTDVVVPLTGRALDRKLKDAPPAKPAKRPTRARSPA